MTITVNNDYYRVSRKMYQKSGMFINGHSVYWQRVMQWWWNRFWQPLTHAVRLSPSTISIRHIGQRASSSSAAKPLDTPFSVLYHHHIKQFLCSITDARKCQPNLSHSWFTCMFVKLHIMGPMLETSSFPQILLKLFFKYFTVSFSSGRLQISVNFS